MMLLRLGFAMAVAALTTSDGRAQDPEAPLGSRIPKPVEMQTAERAASIRTAHGMTECVARSDAEQWSGILATVPGTREEREAFRELASDAGRCLVSSYNGLASKVRLAFQPAALRGPLAEALLERHYTGKAVRRPPLAQPFAWGNAVAIPDMDVDTRTSLVVLDFGDCVYRASPQQVIALFTTEPASDEERAALAALGSHLGPCLPAGVEIAFNPLNLRGALAEAAYRYAATSVVPTSAGVEN